MSRGMTLRRGSGSSRAPALAASTKAAGGNITITALSREVGIASSALRYYESVGLLGAERRTRSGYRMYGPDAADRVRFIRLAQEAGLTLEDIRAVLEPRGSAAGCGAVRGVLTMRLEDVRAKITTLQRFEKALLEGISCRPKHVSDLCRKLCAAAGTDCETSC